MTSNDVLAAALQDALAQKKQFLITTIGEKPRLSVLDKGIASVDSGVLQYKSDDQDVYIPIDAISRLVVFHR